VICIFVLYQVDVDKNTSAGK